MDSNKNILQEIAQKDSRYKVEAYIFVFEALEYTLKKISKRRHISGKELLDGIKNYALEQFGGLAKMVFNQWGIKTTYDFGEIVFTLVDAGLMGKTEKDSKEDFRDIYDFEEIFRVEIKKVK